MRKAKTVHCIRCKKVLRYTYENGVIRVERGGVKEVKGDGYSFYCKECLLL